MSLRNITILAVAVAHWIFPAGACAASLGEIASRKGQVRSETIALGYLNSGSQYSLLYSIDSPRNLRLESRLVIELRQGSSVLASKTLHTGDPDYYTQFRVPRSGAVTLAIRASQTASHVEGRYRLEVNR